MGEATEKALAAKAACAGVGMTTRMQRDGALFAMADALRANMAAILAANALDVEAARAKGTSEPIIDRLALDEGRVEDMASALVDLAALDDPLGQVQVERTLYNGLLLRRVSVPLGVVAVVYEARPNVTADAAGIIGHGKARSFHFSLSYPIVRTGANGFLGEKDIDKRL